MSELTPQMQAALGQVRARVFGAVQVDLPNYTLRLIDGAGAFANAPWSSFVARDDTFGVLHSVDAISDGTGDQAPAVRLTLLPGTSAAAASLASAEMQGSRVRFWLGVVDAATGIVVPDPYLLFDGELDVPTLKWGQNSRSLEWTVVSVFAKFFDLEEGARLADSYHQSIWPGETGFIGVTGVDEQIYWGMDTPSGVSK
jgi:hypothetical protein